MSLTETERARDALRDARRLVILTGAGVSTESGVPDFRSRGGTRSRSEGADAGAPAFSIWDTFDPDEFHYEKFLADPARFWGMRMKLMEALDLANVEPNPAHVAIAAASRSPRLLGHVTQNIDGLFQAAGHAAENLVEVHGSARKVRCIRCSRFFPYEGISLARLPPTCPECGGVVKPGTILFGETLHAPDLARARQWFANADAVLVAGSSLVVHPVAALPATALERGARLVIVNRDATPYDADADAVVRASVGAAVPAILSALVDGP